MSKRRHAEEQILRSPHQAEGGMRISDMCCEHGVSEATYYVLEEVRRPSELHEFRQFV